MFLVINSKLEGMTQVLEDLPQTIYVEFLEELISDLKNGSFRLLEKCNGRVDRKDLVSISLLPSRPPLHETDGDRGE